MAKPIPKLYVTQIESAKPKAKEFRLYAGDGLYVLIRPSGTKTWQFKYNNFEGKARKITIGNFPLISLKQADDIARQYRQLLSEGIDPQERAKGKKLVTSSDNSLETMTRKWFEVYALKKELSNDTKHKRMRKFENHLFPRLGSFEITSLDLKKLSDALEEIYFQSADNAQRIRADLILIFNYAVLQGILTVNQARELDSLDLSAKVKHRPSFRRFEELPLLINRIKNDTGEPLTKLFLQLTLHIFVRSSELRFARWSEINLKKREWVIPAKRLKIASAKFSERGAKMRDSHIVPLSDQVLSLLMQIRQYSGGTEFLFPSQSGNAVFLSETTPNNALRRMGYDTKSDICLHGFRTIARSALSECGLFQRDAIEKQMSHEERNKVVGAYTHMAQFMEERRLVMNWWSSYLEYLDVKSYVSPYQFAHGQVRDNYLRSA